MRNGNSDEGNENSDEAELEHVASGIGEELVAYEVRTSSMQPAFYPRDRVFHRRGEMRDVSALIDRECIIALADGRLVLRRIERSPAKGCFTLLSYRGESIVDAQIAWAMPVYLIERLG